MGWFSSDSTTTSKPSTTTTTTTTEFVPPNRNQRSRCWEARDAFFKCLDANGIIDPLKDKDLATQKCGKEDIQFGKDCVGSWVEYFKKRRVMEHKKEQMLQGLAKEGALKVDLPLPQPKS